MFWTVRLAQARQNQVGQSSSSSMLGGGLNAIGGSSSSSGGINSISNLVHSIQANAAAAANSSPSHHNRIDFNINTVDSDTENIIGDDNSESANDHHHHHHQQRNLLSPNQHQIPQQQPRKRSLVQALLNSANLSTDSNQQHQHQQKHNFFTMDNNQLQSSTGIMHGDPLGIHDPSETELGGVGHENVGPMFVKRSKKILRGLLLMFIVTLCWVSVIHLFHISFHRERILYSISNVGHHFNISKLFSLSSSSSSSVSISPLPSTTTESVLNTNRKNNSIELLPIPMSLSSNKGSKIKLPSTSSFNNDIPRSKFDAPYLVTWYCSIWNIFYMPVYLMIHAYFLSRRSKSVNEQQQQQSSSGGSSAISNNPFGSNISNNKSACSTTGSSSIGTDNTVSSTTSIKKVLIESIQGIIDRGFTLMQFFSRCAFFCTLCLLANYMLIFSLRILDATVVMALFASTISLIYLLSWVVLHQQFVGIRIVGIIVVDTGVALLVYMDGIQNQTLATVMIAFGSAIVFAVYKVFMRRMIGYTTFAQMALFHSLIGILNLILSWPLILILYATGVERIIWSEIPWLFMTGASISLLIANLIASFGVICTYEFFLTLGMFFAIPISAVIDIYINSVIFRDMKLGGVLLILIGVLIVLLPDNWNGYLTNAFRNHLKKWKRREENKKNGRVQDTSTGQLSRLRTSSGRVK